MTNVVHVPGSFDQMGSPIMVAPQGLYEESDEKLSMLGTELKVGERRFRYAKADGALTAGKLAVSSITIQVEDTVTVAHPVGTFNVTVNLITAAENLLADGYLYVDEGTGAGDNYRIKGHAALTSGNDGVIQLLDPLRTAWSTSDTDIQVQTNPYICKTSVADQLDLPVGVPLIDVQDGYYFWLQVQGPCVVLLDEAEGADTNQRLLTIGSSVAGAVEVYDAAGENIVGYTAREGDYEDAKYQLIILDLP